MEDKPTCRALILKVASRCNLNCTYCYVYNAGDTTYMTQPKSMDDETVDAIISGVLKHCLKHQIRHFEFIFHGGEPLLIGKEFYQKFVEKARYNLLPEVMPSFSIQTNGTLLNTSWCKVLGMLNIKVGISLDGIKAVNDHKRIDHQGQGSYDRIVKGIRYLQSSPYIDAFGILSVVNIDADPVETYHHLKSLSVAFINFLLPYASYDHPPPRFDPKKTLYGDWLISLFDEWFDDKAPKPKIRLFEQIIASLLGIDSRYEMLGKSSLQCLVVETDGSIEVSGSLKICGNGFTKKGLNILFNDLDEAFEDDLSKVYLKSHSLLPDKCQKCFLVKVCGGGLLTHRYSKLNGFNNPSIFCHDLMRLIDHIQSRMQELILTSEHR